MPSSIKLDIHLQQASPVHILLNTPKVPQSSSRTRVQTTRFRCLHHEATGCHWLLTPSVHVCVRFPTSRLIKAIRSFGQTALTTVGTVVDKTWVMTSRFHRREFFHVSVTQDNQVLTEIEDLNKMSGGLTEASNERYCNYNGRARKIQSNLLWLRICCGHHAVPFAKCLFAPEIVISWCPYDGLFSTSVLNCRIIG